MNREPRTRLDDPAAEHTSDHEERDEAAVRRTPEGRDGTPRRYDRATEDDDPVMPADDPSLGTKI